MFCDKSRLRGCWIPSPTCSLLPARPSPKPGSFPPGWRLSNVAINLPLMRRLHGPWLKRKASPRHCEGSLVFRRRPRPPRTNRRGCCLRHGVYYSCLSLHRVRCLPPVSRIDWQQFRAATWNPALPSTPKPIPLSWTQRATPMCARARSFPTSAAHTHTHTHIGFWEMPVRSSLAGFLSALRRRANLAWWNWK